MFRGVEFLKNVVENMLDRFLQYALLKQPLINIFNIVDIALINLTHFKFLALDE